MSILQKGRYRAVQAETPEALERGRALRALCFGVEEPSDDPIDARCIHIHVEDGGRLVGCFRMMPVQGPEILHSYAAQFYDLQALSGFEGVMLEIGRFCVHPDAPHADVLRMAWGVLTSYVDAHDVRLLFGCSSFAGTEAADYKAAFSVLQAQHLGPPEWRPGVRAPELILFDQDAPQPAQTKQGLQAMPPLLRTYLMMGGWVSDHAVIDRQMNTLHVFTAVEIDRIPSTRASWLRSFVR